MFFIDLGTQSYYSILGIAPTATAEEIRVTKDKLILELREKLKLAQTEEKKQIEDKILEINRIGGELSRPQKRAKYDEEHAHLGFLTLQSAAAGIFVSKSDQLYCLHRILQNFLSEKGVELQPLSDVDREEFLSDETPVALLDDLLRQI